MNIIRSLKTLAASAIACLSIAAPALACTNIRLIAQDGSVIHARTMEFAIDIHSKILIVPRGFARVGLTPSGQDGIKWTAKYASIGMNGVGEPYLFDGVNEKGLSAALLYFPNYAGYMPYTAAQAGKTLAPWQLGSYILENFATVAEVKANIGKVVVPAVVFAGWGFTPGVHYEIDDQSGHSIVIEYVGGKLVVYDNPLGVLTNAPSFDWQMTNLHNYVNFSMTNVPPIKLSGGVTLTPFGQGSGMLGIPGDFTPPSRFVRAVAFTQSAFPTKTGADAILEAFHILNQFDIPVGAARENEKDSHGNIQADYTIWTSAIDLKTQDYYFRTYTDSQIREVSLNKANLNAKTITEIPIDGSENIQQITP
jgi:choloylglycine hydrolase